MQEIERLREKFEKHYRGSLNLDRNENGWYVEQKTTFIFNVWIAATEIEREKNT